MRAATVSACAFFGVQLRPPEPDELPLSASGVVCGMRAGVFDGVDPLEERVPVFVLERRDVRQQRARRAQA